MGPWRSSQQRAWPGESDLHNSRRSREVASPEEEAVPGQGAAKSTTATVARVFWRGKDRRGSVAWRNESLGLLGIWPMHDLVLDQILDLNR